MTTQTTPTSPDITDLVVVGGGAAGLTAGLYAVRRGASTVIVTKDVGGQASLTHEIENYPGIPFVGGRELMEIFWNQAIQFGCTTLTDEVRAIYKNNDDTFTVQLSHTTLSARAVILAFGLTPRDLDIANENDLKGEKLFYSLPIDYRTRAWKQVAVVGGGNSALEAAIALAAEGVTVHVVHRRPEFRADSVLLHRAQQSELIQWHTPFAPSAFADSSFHITHAETGDHSQLSVDAVIACLGYMAKTDIAGDLVERNDRGEIIVTKHNHTKTPGLFAAGDVTELSYKQLTVAVGEATKAAMEAVQYINHQTNRKPIPDWGLKPKKS